MQITSADAVSLTALVRRLSGISINPGNMGFLELRLSRRMRELQISDFNGYRALLGGPEGTAEANHLVEMLATHTTSFFRENTHYEWMRAHGLPELFAAGAGKEYPLSLWSAACSLGSELWSAAMIVDQFALEQRGGMLWKATGTDISRRVLQRAASATFTEAELSGLPDDYRRRYMMRSRHSVANAEQALFRVVPELRSQTRFARLNLIRPSPEFQLNADIIFLRNVLIYFEPADQIAALGSVLRRLRPGGFLMTGHSEALMETPKGMTQVAPSIYRKEGG